MENSYILKNDLYFFLDDMNIGYDPLANSEELAFYLDKIHQSEVKFVPKKLLEEKGVFISYKCDNPGCGSHFYNGGVAVHNIKEDTKMVIGWDCMDKIDNGQLRSKVAEKQSRKSKKAESDEWMPNFYSPKYFKKIWLDCGKDNFMDNLGTLGKNYKMFILSITEFYMENDYLTKKQCESLEKAMLVLEKNLDQIAQDKAELNPMVSERRAIKGRIISVNQKNNPYGYVDYRAIILTADKLKFFCNLPNESIMDFGIDLYKNNGIEIEKLVNANISMNITLAPSSNNEYFGFGKRPTKVIISE